MFYDVNGWIRWEWAALGSVVALLLLTGLIVVALRDYRGQYLFESDKGYVRRAITNPEEFTNKQRAIARDLRRKLRHSR